MSADAEWLIRSAAKHLVETRQARDYRQALAFLRRALGNEMSKFPLVAKAADIHESAGAR